MKIYYVKKENNKKVKEWSLEIMGRKTEPAYKEKKAERERAKADKHRQKQFKREKKKQSVEEKNLEIMLENIDNYNGDESGMKNYIKE